MALFYSTVSNIGHRAYLVELFCGYYKKPELILLKNGGMQLQFVLGNRMETLKDN